mmetsp:Transcript_31214/g.89472  ORF Transcript_31214/g.89472 Transcript_31214/m.89472 type:complete len:223 (-) Transcript_31214:184-852(-)
MTAPRHTSRRCHMRTPFGCSRRFAAWGSAAGRCAPAENPSRARPRTSPSSGATLGGQILRPARLPWPSTRPSLPLAAALRALAHLQERRVGGHVGLQQEQQLGACGSHEFVEQRPNTGCWPAPEAGGQRLVLRLPAICSCQPKIEYPAELIRPLGKVQAELMEKDADGAFPKQAAGIGIQADLPTIGQQGRDTQRQETGHPEDDMANLELATKWQGCQNANQ